MIAAHRYIKEHTDDFYDLDADQAKFEREEAFTGCESVSYTHLCCVRASRRKSFASSGTRWMQTWCMWTVSYTHLDVYKRQI